MDSSSRPNKGKRQRVTVDLLLSSSDEEEDGNNNSVNAYSVRDDDDEDDDTSSSEDSSIFKEFWEDDVQTEIATHIEAGSQSVSASKDAGVCTQPAPPIAVPGVSRNRVQQTQGVPQVVVPIKGQASTPESLAMSSATQPSPSRGGVRADSRWMQHASKESISPCKDSDKKDVNCSVSKKRKQRPKSSNSAMAMPKPAKVSLSPSRKAANSKVFSLGSNVLSLEAAGTTTLTKAVSMNGSKTPVSKKKGAKANPMSTDMSPNVKDDGASPTSQMDAKPAAKQMLTKKSKVKPRPPKKPKKLRGGRDETGESCEGKDHPIVAKSNSTDADAAITKQDSSTMGAPTIDEPKVAKTAAPSVPRRKKRTFQDDILLHMLLSCKPFSLKTLAKSLNTTDTALNFVMLSLVDKNLVVKKEFATKKSTKELYWANQDSTAKEIMALQMSSEEMKLAAQEFRVLQRQDTELTKGLAVVSQEMSSAELVAQLQKSEDTVDGLRFRLQETHNRIKAHAPPAPTTLKTSVVPSISAAVVARERCPRRMKMRINAMRGEWKKRKEKCMDFVDQLADGMEKKVKDVVKLLEIETDEMEGVTMPLKHEIE